MRLSKICVSAAVVTTAILSGYASAAPISFQNGVFPSTSYLNSSSGSTDVTVRADSPTTNQEGNGAILVGQKDRNTPFRGLFSFNLSALPTNATITSASLTLHIQQPDSGAGTVETLQYDLYNTSSYTVTSAVWNNKPTPVSLLNSVSIKNGANSSGGDTGYKTFASSTSFINAVQAAYNGSGTVYFSLQEANEGSATNIDNLRHIIFFDSNENLNPSSPGTAAYRPRLDVTYSVPEPASLGLLSAGALLVLRRRRSV